MKTGFLIAVLTLSFFAPLCLTGCAEGTGEGGGDAVGAEVGANTTVAPVATTPDIAVPE